MKHRNAVLIIADDWDRISRCYGNPFIRTPNIDRFAQKAVVFDQAFCTTPSCAASRACILTGRHSHTHGQYGHCHGREPFRTHEDMVTIPQVTEQAGLFSGIVGKSHVAPMEKVYPFSFVELGDLYKPHLIGERVDRFFEVCGDRNFYLHVAFGDPHRRGSDCGFHNGFEIPGFEQPRYGLDEVMVPDFLPDEPEVRQDLVEYYEAVSRFDHGVGLVLDALAKAGREEDTMVIVTSDHSMPFPGAKASSFDTGHHCPLLIFTPELRNKGGRHNALMNWVDLAPTIYDWCGLTGPSDLPGRSLVPILDDPDISGWDETILSHTCHSVVDYHPYRILRNRQYKLVYHCADSGGPFLPSDLFRSKTWQCVKEKNLGIMGQRPTERLFKWSPVELFDIQADPFETTSLSELPEYSRRVEEMQARLLDFCAATGDPWLEMAFQRGHFTADLKMQQVMKSRNEKV